MTQFEEINSFCLYLSSFTALNKKRCLHQIQIFFWLFSLSNMLIKVIFLSISALLSEIVIFWLKRVVFSEFPWKYFKTTWKNSLAVCGSFWGEKQFLLNLFPFTGLIKTVVYTKSKFSSCGSFWGEKQFLLNLFPFTGLIKTVVYTKSKFSSGFAPFQTFLKTNFLSISDLLSEIVMF